MWGGKTRSDLPDSLAPMPIGDAADLESGGGGGGGIGGIGASVTGWLSKAAAQLPSVAEQKAKLTGAVAAEPTTGLDRLDCCGGMSKKQRLLAFGASLVTAAICFILALTMLPTLVLMPRKVLLLLTLGNVSSMASFAFLRGPAVHLRSMVSPQNRMLTFGYVLSTVLTLYCTLVLKSALFTVIMAVIQVVVVFVFLGSYLPFGGRVASFVGSLFWRSTKSAASAITG
jgi:hypothetical protein